MGQTTSGYASFIQGPGRYPNLWRHRLGVPLPITTPAWHPPVLESPTIAKCLINQQCSIQRRNEPCVFLVSVCIQRPRQAPLNLQTDAGGFESVSQLEILVELMHTLNYDNKPRKATPPCTVFDFIGGVGIGGFIAILLVVFGLTAKEALDEFKIFTAEILERGGVDANTRTDCLELYIEELLKKRGVEKDERITDRHERSKQCKLVIPLFYKHNLGNIRIMRNFAARRELGLDITIAEAIRATLAIPPLFRSIAIIKGSAAFEYIGAASILSNPIREILAEAHGDLDPEELVACILSLGCCHCFGFHLLPDSSTSARFNELLEQLGTQALHTHQEIQRQITNVKLYHQFTAPLKLRISQDSISCLDRLLEPARWLVRLIQVIAAKLGLPPQCVWLSSTDISAESFISGVIAETGGYIESVQLEKEEWCESIRLREGILTLEKLVHCGTGRLLPRAPPPVTRKFIARVESGEHVKGVLLGEGDSENVSRQKMLPVTGGPGYGKSQIIFKFIEDYNDKFQHVFVVDGSSKERIRANITHHVRSIGVEHSQKSFNDCLIYLAQPSSKAQRLIVYDNVDDPDLNLTPLIPQGRSSAIVITSRNRSIGDICHDAHLELTVMSIEEAIDLLAHGLGLHLPLMKQTWKELMQIAKILGCHPMALSQACSYMYITPCNPSGYLNRLKQSPHAMLKHPSPYSSDMRYASTFAAFDASFQIIPSDVRTVLQLLSCVHWNKFPRDLIILAAEHNFSSYEFKCSATGEGFAAGSEALKKMFHSTSQSIEINLDDILVSLQNYSLVKVEMSDDMSLLHIHPLFHGWVYLSIEEKDRPIFHSTASLLLALGARKQPALWSRHLASHLSHLLSIWTPSELNDCWAFGCILSEAGHYEGALEMWGKVVKELRTRLQPDDSIFHRSLEMLSDTYSKLGRLEEALKAAEEVEELRRNAFGSLHESTLPSMRNLANIYRSLGRFTEAEKVLAAILECSNNESTEWSSEVVLTLSDLALTYRQEGRLSDAKRIQEDALELTRERNGGRHASTMEAMEALAQTYHDMRRFDKAKEIQSNLFDLRLATDGERNPTTIEALSALALTYKDMGDLDVAKELQEKAGNLLKEVLGVGHQDTLSAHRRLGQTYCAMSRCSEAEALQISLLESTREIFGEQHPATMSASQSLADLYCDLGQYSKAVELQVAVLALRKKTLDDADPEVIVASSNLASTYHHLGQHAEAEELRTEVFRLSKRSFGEEHPNTISALQNLALTKRERGCFKEAEMDLLEVWNQRTQLFGDQNTDTIDARSELENTRRAMEQSDQGHPLMVLAPGEGLEADGERPPETPIDLGPSDEGGMGEYIGELTDTSAPQIGDSRSTHELALTHQLAESPFDLQLYLSNPHTSEGSVERIDELLAAANWCFQVRRYLLARKVLVEAEAMIRETPGTPVQRTSAQELMKRVKEYITLSSARKFHVR